MNRFSLTHLSNEVLRRELTAKAAKEKEATAELLAHIAEFDERKLYLPAACYSMLDYCMRELLLSEEAAKKRIRVARVGHVCPGVFEALAAGRVHLGGLVVLATYLSPENASELLTVASHKSREEIERIVAERFPRLDVPAQVTPVSTGSPSEHVEPGSAGNVDRHEVTVPLVDQRSPGTVNLHARVAPLSAEAYAVQFTRSREADERFRRAQDLLGHLVAPNDIAEVYDRAVKELIAKLQRTRFAATARPRRPGTTSAGSRRISAHVQRVVWERDEGQCTYLSESGRRCEARRGLQFDHVKEFARGGEASVGNIRLRCPGHNQHAAEQTFGAGFMKQKRERAAKARAAAKAARERARAGKAAEAERSRLRPHQLEVLPWLEQLGCRKDESRIAVERCREMADAPLEERVKRALSWFGARIARTVSYAPAT